MSAGSVSNSSVLQIFQVAWNDRFARKSVFSVIRLDSRLSRIVIKTQRSLEMRTSNIVTHQSGLPVSSFTFCRKFMEPVRIWLMLCGCRFSRQSSGEHAWPLPFSMWSWTLWPYRHHCVHHVSLTLLYSEAPSDWPLVMIEPFLYTVRSVTCWCIQWETSCFICWPFSTMSSDVFRQECLVVLLDLVWKFLPFFGLLESCLPAYL